MKQKEPTKKLEEEEHGLALSARPTLSTWLAIGLSVAVFFASRLFKLEFAHPAWRIGGVSLLALGAPLMLLPFLLLRRHGATPAGAPYHATTRLVDTGLYRVIRHPQYLGYSLLTLGFAMLSGRWWLLLPAMLAGLCYYLQARAEEKHCRELFGHAAYEAYCSRTARFCPLRGTRTIFSTSKQSN